MANLDHLQHFANQNVEKRYFGCVGETISDILGNTYGVVLDPDFSEAAGYAVQGAPPSNLGETAVSALYGAVAFGALPDALDTSDPLQTNELTENNFANYDYKQKSTAVGFAPSGINWCNSFGDISRHLLQYRTGVAVGFKWYDSFMHPYPDGTLRLPGDGESFTYHETACYENTSQELRIKPWLGADFGDKGYVYVPRYVFDKTWTGAAGFKPGSRWLSLVQAALTYPTNIHNLLPLLFSAARMK